MQANFEKLRPGMTEREVLDLMGPPEQEQTCGDQSKRPPDRELMWCNYFYVYVGGDGIVYMAAQRDGDTFKREQLRARCPDE
jgi:hypothetical protein